MTQILAAQRGIPSLAWGLGQQRRLDMVVRRLGLSVEHASGQALINGCGAGLYLQRLTPFYDDVFGIDIEPRYLESGRLQNPAGAMVQGACEYLPLPDKSMDMIFSHEVLEHVADDRQAMAEMARVVKPDGHIVLFVPNRWFPFETHGFFLDGTYCWGNIPLVNYLPRPWRDRLVPHVRAYDAQSIWTLCHALPLKIVFWTQIWPGFDAMMHRMSSAGRILKATRALCEESPLRTMGISHFLILQSLESP